VAAAIEQGWDSRVVVEGDRLLKIPRRPEVEQALVVEAELLAEVAPALPATVPRPRLVERDGRRCLLYRRLEGERFHAPTHVLAHDLGRFLAALHRFRPVAPVARYDPGSWRETFRELCATFARRVLPLLDEADRDRGAALLATEPDDFEPALVHGDLGPEHVLVREGRLAGVIDWTDARVGDPALDFAWLLHGPPPWFGEALLDAYGGPPDRGFRARARLYHRLGPWYEVVHGQTTGCPELVESGLAGVRERLP
jgi:aminoglycoside phosphotransferase (APT) family kinase protein